MGENSPELYCPPLVGHSGPTRRSKEHKKKFFLISRSGTGPGHDRRSKQNRKFPDGTSGAKPAAANTTEGTTFGRVGSLSGTDPA